jgi:chloramphenicol 3-O phosphotransferase
MAVSTQPRVVILNGGSSAGKTTLAGAFRDRRSAVGDFWLVTAIDDVLAKLPADFREAGSERGAFASDGVRFETTARGLEVRVGPRGRQLFGAYQAGAAAAARAGLNVIVDDVMIDRTHFEGWIDVLSGLDVVWVGVRCSADVAEAREALRRDSRYAGLARTQADLVHRYTGYDFEIDTTTRTPDAVLSDLVRGLGY